MTTAKTLPGGLSRFQLTAYAGAYFSTILLSAPVANFLPQLYAKELGVSHAALYAHFEVAQPAFALRARLRCVDATTRSLLERTLAQCRHDCQE